MSLQTASTAPVSHRGHCRCGAVVMVAHAVPNISVYCHCDDCRRSCGAPVIASVGFPKDAVEWGTDETLMRYCNGTATRLFCGKCGSPVAQEHDSAADTTFFNTGFMDRPNDFPPTAHTFAGRRLDWLELHDGLPRVEKTILIKTE
ncbi:MAG: hypothetical protein VR78_03930 [Hoeflea sp. BRH_c9]|nr:MAG: hypothetical protein VR78_03930 [Hoeflea sp. BRH_c9]